MNPAASATRLAYNDPGWLDTLAAWLLALLWVLPLAYAVFRTRNPQLRALVGALYQLPVALPPWCWPPASRTSTRATR